MERWPMQGPFDVILCRNVMIYFDKATQQQLVDRYWALLRPGGYLFVGHSESLTGLTHQFRYVQPAAYVK
jgi:chemotaxis protein methyltransferase CheR